MHTFLCSITISIDRCCSVMDLRSGRAFAWVNKDQISLLCIFKAIVVVQSWISEVGERLHGSTKIKLVYCVFLKQTHPGLLHPKAGI